MFNLIPLREGVNSFQGVFVVLSVLFSNKKAITRMLVSMAYGLLEFIRISNSGKLNQIAKYANKMLGKVLAKI